MSADLFIQNYFGQQKIKNKIFEKSLVLVVINFIWSKYFNPIVSHGHKQQGNTTQGIEYI